MKRTILALAMLAVCFAKPFAQVAQHGVAMEPFGSNWYTQLGLDMSLQCPYNHNFSKVFPNGKSFGVDAALGRWFTPELGLRVKMNWENGIPLFENGHANWLAPFNKPGVNMDKGGYASFVGDVQIDLHNLICGYDETRKWHLQLFPRAGLIYNFGAVKGSPLIGIGVGNTYRINDRLTIYCDAAMQLVSSGFTGDSSTGTGTGTNANGFFDLNLGVQFNLGKSGFRKAMESGDVVVDNAFAGGAFSHGWFVQAGMDMMLQNAYNHKFSQTFPKGKTFGVDLALGKRFSPEVALRLRADWENGLSFLKNNHLEWLGSGSYDDNTEGGGCLMTYMDVQLNMSNIIFGYDSDRKLEVYAFPRAGLAMNRAIDSCSPMVGGGVGASYRLDERWSIYADAAYQATTSEFYAGVSGAGTGMSVPRSANGFLDVQIGVQFDLGK